MGIYWRAAACAESPLTPGKINAGRQSLDFRHDHAFATAAAPLPKHESHRLRDDSAEIHSAFHTRQ